MSGIAFNYGTEGEEMDTYLVTERLCLTEPDEAGGQRAVPEGHADARWFYAAEGVEVPMAEAERYGLLKPAKKAPAKKEAK